MRRPVLWTNPCTTCSGIVWMGYYRREEAPVIHYCGHIAFHVGDL